jgi:dTMP kinase
LLFEALKEGKHGDFIAVSPKIASTLYAVDRFEAAPKIREWLGQGDIVISDRYASANQIHQGGKIADPAIRKEFLEWLDTLEFKTLGIPRPDIIVYLHVPLEVSLELIRSRAAETGTVPDQAEADAKHLYESQESALKLISESNNWLRIDCAEGGNMKSREAIHAAIIAGLRDKGIL